MLDAPHTGARLETAASWAEPVKSPMPPTRGHDLKLLKLGVFGLDLWMPPTRGHDLKQLVRGPMRVPGGDAPTPGNVLKYFAPHLANTPGDAPTVSLLSVLLSSLFSLTLFYSKQLLALKPMLLSMQIILLIFSH